jgi:hypothetical protein
MVRWLTLLIATWLMDADMVVDERVALPDISNSVYISENRGEHTAGTTIYGDSFYGNLYVIPIN